MSFLSARAAIIFGILFIILSLITSLIRIDIPGSPGWIALPHIEQDADPLDEFGCGGTQTVTEIVKGWPMAAWGIYGSHACDNRVHINIAGLLLNVALYAIVGITIDQALRKRTPSKP